MTACDSLGEVVSEHRACVQLLLENRPENVAVVRAALRGVAHASELDSETATDVLTAVSEACNNVVIHAYGGECGPMRVVIASRGDRLDVVVADDGTGILRVSSSADHMGLGLALISALSDHAVFHSPRDGGTEVRMRFRSVQPGIEPEPEPGPAGGSRAEPTPGATAEPDAEPGFPLGVWASEPRMPAPASIAMRVEPAAMVRYVVGPVARAAASASHFTIAGASDLYAINDAVAGFAELAADTHLDVTIATAPHRLTLDAGPIIAWFTGDGADAASRSSGDDGELEDRREALAGLVHRLSVEPCDGGKLLRLQLLDRGRAPVAGA